MKSFLFVMRSSAYKGTQTQEFMDEVLITAAFDQQVSLLLLDDAVFQLKKNQQANTVNAKNISAIYRSLALYDIEHIYIEQESLQERGLHPDDLLLSTVCLARSEIAEKLKAFDYVLGG